MADCSADVIASIFSGEKEAWAKSFIAPLADLQLRETPSVADENRLSSAVHANASILQRDKAATVPR